jgi:hypothetical protein
VTVDEDRDERGVDRTDEDGDADLGDEVGDMNCRSACAIWKDIVEVIFQLSREWVFFLFGQFVC